MEQVRDVTAGLNQSKIKILMAMLEKIRAGLRKEK
jgi:hypothetical protein